MCDSNFIYNKKWTLYEKKMKIILSNFNFSITNSIISVFWYWNAKKIYGINNIFITVVKEWFRFFKVHFDQNHEIYDSVLCDFQCLTLASRLRPKCYKSSNKTEKRPKSSEGSDKTEKRPKCYKDSDKNEKQRLPERSRRVPPDQQKKATSRYSTFVNISWFTS